MSAWNIFKKTHQVGKLQTNTLESIILKTISLMEDCNNYKSEGEVISAINEIADNKSLAWELYCLIPIAFTRLVVTDAKYSDEVVLNFKNGKQQKELLSNMDIFTSILKVVNEKIQNGKNEKVEAILFLSAEFNAIHNAILNGSKMKNLVLSPLMLFVPDNYSLL